MGDAASPRARRLSRPRKSKARRDGNKVTAKSLNQLAAEILATILADEEARAVWKKQEKAWKKMLGYPGKPRRNRKPARAA